MKKNILKILGIFVLGAFGGIFADQILWPYLIERPLFYQYRLEQSPVYVTETKEITVEENVALQGAIERSEKIVVGIKSERKSGEVLEGSGFIATSDGLIVTLNNLLPYDSEFSFFVDGKSVAFQVLKRDPENNLALVKLEKNNLPTLAFADFDKTKLGERVFLVGAIFQSGVIKKVVNEGIIKDFDDNFIETSITDKIDLKGSPLFNISGEILGINTVNSAGEIVAIPVSKIKQFIKI
ncbi:MAG: serine protease [Candidatus Paceibacterota bacterium]